MINLCDLLLKININVNHIREVYYSYAFSSHAEKIRDSRIMNTQVAMLYWGSQKFALNDRGRTTIYPEIKVWIYVLYI